MPPWRASRAIGYLLGTVLAVAGSIGVLWVLSLIVWPGTW